MKKLILVLFTLLFAVSLSPAADFSPTVMTLACPEELKYAFDGSPLTIPFTIEGVGGSVWLVINTKGQAENIRDVRNGNLGWHYVHKTDTTVYVSQRYERDKGSAEIVWDGRNQDEDLVEPGEYDYYLWAYDDMSNKKLVSGVVPIGFRERNQASQIYEYDESGMPLPRPLIMGNYNLLSFDETVPQKRYGTHFKWEIGADPLDLNSLQTTMCSMYNPLQPMTFWIDDRPSENPDFVEYGSPVWDPTDYSVFYHPSYRNRKIFNEGGTWGFLKEFTMLKWEFMPDGEAVLDQEWFGWEDDSWRLKAYTLNIANCSTDGNYIYFTNPSRGDTAKENNYLYCMDFDGDMVFEKMMHDWYFPEEAIQNNEVNCSIDKLYIRPHNRLFMLGIDCCLHQLIRTNRLLEDPDDETDMVVFENRNGDYFLDNWYEPNVPIPWVCIADRKNRLGYQSLYKFRRSVCIDSNDFNIFYMGGLSGVSIAVSTQDGTGIDYMAFADEHALADETYQMGGLLCDTGSNYDGLYMGGTYFAPEYWKKDDAMSTNFIAFDSCRGVITNDTAVEEESPAVFHVEQNTPNPFNPATTIAYTIPETSQVQVAVYNVAGQKVATLADDFMAAGKHVVTWDAADFSAGVYFCRVKAGRHENTVKMTMVK